MGMFDWVNVEMKCPCCGEPVCGFQSKDSECTLDKIDPDYVNYFYSICYHCRTRIEFSRTSGKIERKVRETPYSRQDVEDMGFTVYTEELPWMK